jgi:hypothetical protein
MLELVELGELRSDHGVRLGDSAIDTETFCFGWASGKYPITIKARRLLWYWVVRKWGVSATALSKKLGASLPSVSISVKHGEQIAKTKGLELFEE